MKIKRGVYILFDGGIDKVLYVSKKYDIVETLMGRVFSLESSRFEVLKKEEAEKAILDYFGYGKQKTKVFTSQTSKAKKRTKVKKKV